MAQIEFDEGGGTFSYFLVLLYGLFVLILTYILWPRNTTDESKNKTTCHCGPCCRKRTIMDKGQIMSRLLKYLRVVVLIILWGSLVLFIYWTLTQEQESVEWDPFEILQIDRSASIPEIKKQYRLLSKTHHPDKGGDPEVFTRIAKAYEALTHEEAKENWEKYGNPDGPKAATFGIALPSWIVDKDNSLLVLGVYVGIFMVGLPVIVGTWWYRSVKYGMTNILIQTSQIYSYTLSRAKTIPLKRIIMILATAVEFTNKQQAGVKDRRSDDVYLNQLVKQLEHSIKIETREPPFNQTYVAKTRLLLHAYLEHVELQDPGLIQDQAAIVKYSPFLINEMMLILNQVWSYAKMYKGNKIAQKKVPEPSLDMYESVMRLSQIIVQSLWLPFQPLLQLPHINNEQLKFFFHKKRRINTIEEFANLKSDERRRLLKNLSDEEYHDIIVFCQTYPHIEMKVETEVPDDEDSSLISAGSFVNIKVYLRRCSLLEQGDDTIENEIMSNVNQSSNPPNDDNIIDNDSNKEIIEGVMPEILVASEVASKETSNKGGKGGGKKPKKKGKVQQKKKPQNVRKRPQQEQNKEEHNKKQEQTNDIKKENNRESDVSEDEDREGEGLDDEDKEWKELQKSIRKEKEQMKNQIDTSSLVHAPYFPADKHELWWVCVADRKTNSIVVPPQKVTGLKNEKEVTLKMMAERKGLFKYVVILTSDSYLNCTIQQELKIKVHEKKEVSGTEQWADLEKEEDEEDMIEESVTESDSDDEDDDN